MVISDIPYNSPYTSLDDDLTCIRISSDDNTACEIVYNIIIKMFKNDNRIFKFVSFKEDIDELKVLCDIKTVKLVAEKRKYKFFSVAYPELHAEVSNDENLHELLTRWQSTVYQTYLLYIVENDKAEILFEVLKKNAYRETDSLSEIKTDIKMLVKNEWEAENHNTFVIVLRKEYLNEIRGVISGFLREA